MKYDIRHGFLLRLEEGLLHNLRHLYAFVFVAAKVVIEVVIDMVCVILLGVKQRGQHRHYIVGEDVFVFHFITSGIYHAAEDKRQGYRVL